MNINKNNFCNPVSMKDIRIKDDFWGKRMDLVRTKMLPYQWRALNDQLDDDNKSYCIKNYRIAAGMEKGEFHGFPFADTDLTKWLEAVAYSLTSHPDEDLEKIADNAIDLIASAQREDGYLVCYYIINGIENRWTNLTDMHELYCAGHLTQAAVAYYHATGKRKLLDVAIRFIDHIDTVLGGEEGKLRGYPGHEVIEMALIGLFHITKDEKHLNLAKYFIDERGREPKFFDEEAKRNRKGEKHWLADSPIKHKYYQVHKPVREQDSAEGHAVRAVYLYSGMVDVARETLNSELLNACFKIWQNMVYKRMYITGGIGSSAHGEAFTFDYDLPNDTAYTETCASIGLVILARKFLQTTPNGAFADVMERALYNGVISGMSLDGTEFFYVNPLEVVPEACEKDALRGHVKPTRQKWFGCACCPPNLARLMASLPNYLYMQSQDGVYVNLYMGNESVVTIKNQTLRLEMKTNYPWEGEISITIREGTKEDGFLAFRIPEWCRSHQLKKNGTPFPNIAYKDGYVYVRDGLNKGDELQLTFDMPVERIASNPHVRENIGKVAIMRGPIVYCLEEVDNGNRLDHMVLPYDAGFDVSREERELGGLVKLKCIGKKQEIAKEGDRLYYPYQTETYNDQVLTWIPYYAWANRGIGEMKVWITNLPEAWRTKDDNENAQ